MNPDDLIRIARLLAGGMTGGGLGRPRDADLRRAVSAAYYALFHALAACCADTLIGSSPRTRSQQAWRQTYRALDHGPAKERCARREIEQFPQDIQDFAASFVKLQGRRHTADYDPLPDRGSGFYRSDVLKLIGEVEEMIGVLNAASDLDRRAFAALVLFRLRRD